MVFNVPGCPLKQLRPIDHWFIAEVLPHEPHFLNVARRLLGGADEARDLVQEAFAKLFQIDGWAAITNPRGYVDRMLHNLVYARVRRARIVEFRALTAIDVAGLRDEAPDALREVAGRRQVERVAAIVAGLPEKYRVVLVRCRLGQQSPSEVARALGISLSTLEKRLGRALQLLSAALDPDTELDEPTTAPAPHDHRARASS